MGYAALVNGTSYLMLLLDLEGRITDANPATATLYGRPAHELVGVPFQAVLEPGSQTKAGLLLARTLAEGAVTDWELSHWRPGAPPVLISYATVLLREASGALRGIGVIGRDLSAGLDLTIRLATTNQELEGALLQLEGPKRRCRRPISCWKRG